jgi:hypothetical protein
LFVAVAACAGMRRGRSEQTAAVFATGGRAEGGREAGAVYNRDLIVSRDRTLLAFDRLPSALLSIVFLMPYLPILHTSSEGAVSQGRAQASAYAWQRPRLRSRMGLVNMCGRGRG